MTNKKNMSEEDFKNQYLQEYKGSDKSTKTDNFKKYVHRKTGRIIEAEYDKMYHGQWCYELKNPFDDEPRIMEEKWFDCEYKLIKE